MKRLLICTQAVDENHPLLGFFLQWVKEFAKKYDEVHVICLTKGAYTLPGNVYVYSLGKEEGKGRMMRVWRFYTYIWKLRHKYDDVFVHMNEVYVLLGGVLWRIFHKRIGLWYAHGFMSRRIKLATAISHYIFTSTQSGFRFRTRKKLIVGQGISMEQFVCADRPERTELALLFVGRLSPIKGIPTIFAACEILKKEGIPFHLTVVGGANIPLEEAHKKELETYVDVHNLQEEITFVGSVPNRELRSYLCDADIFLNPGRTGSLDKAGVEAMAAGLVVLTCNEAYEEVLGEEHTDELMFPKDDAFTLASRIKDFADKEKRVMVGMRLRELANTHHSVEGLIERIHRVYVH